MNLSTFSHLASYALENPVARRSPMRTAMRIGAWQFKVRTGSGPFVFDWIGGSKLLVTKGMTGATGNIYYGLQEFNEMSFLLHMLREGDLFLDVGANIGSFSVLAAAVCKANCWTFEPSPATLVHLRANIELNKIQDSVTVYDVALGDHDGTVQMSRDFGPMNMIVSPSATDDGAVLLLPEDRIAASKTDDVTICRLDSLTENAAPILMKIDVEGHEQAMLAGAEKTLALPSLLAVQVETVTPAMQAQFANNGFVERYYNPLTRALSDRLTSGAVHNRIYVRNEEQVVARVLSAPPIDVMGVRI